MRKILFASAVALLGLAAGVPAQAMPFPPLSDAHSGVTLVAMGCGPAWTRGPYGGCHPMGYVGRPVYGYGYHPYYHPYYHPHAYRRCWWRAGVRVCG